MTAIERKSQWEEARKKLEVVMEGVHSVAAASPDAATIARGTPEW